MPDMKKLHCPDLDTLQEWVRSGENPESQTAAHLTSCASCRGVAEGIRRSIAYWNPPRSSDEGCLSEETLMACSQGTLEGPEKKRVSMHLADCAECRTSLTLFEEYERQASSKQAPLTGKQMGRRTPLFSAAAVLLSVGAMVGAVQTGVLSVGGGSGDGEFPQRIPEGLSTLPERATDLGGVQLAWTEETVFTSAKTENTALVLTEGELTVSVANEGIKFAMATPCGRVEVLGTRFRVQVWRVREVGRGEEKPAVCVEVLDGRVAVESGREQGILAKGEIGYLIGNGKVYLQREPEKVTEIRIRRGLEAYASVQSGGRQSRGELIWLDLLRMGHARPELVRRMAEEHRKKGMANPVEEAYFQMFQSSEKKER